MPVDLVVPTVGESITEVQIGQWRLDEGDTVRRDDSVVEIESDKATVELPAPVSGRITKILKKTGETAAVGDVIGHMEEEEVSSEPPKPRMPKDSPQEKSSTRVERARKSVDGGADKPPSAPAAPEAPKDAPQSGRPVEHVEKQTAETRVMPAARRALEETGIKAADVRPTGPGGRLLKEDVLRHREEPPARQSPPPEKPQESSETERSVDHGLPSGARDETATPMSPIRRRIAERLVQAQSQAALLTTFNEVDMSAVIELRKSHQEAFTAAHGVKLGFMSFFVRASVDALLRFPLLNSELRDGAIVTRHYCDIGVAIGGGKGLVVPVLRNAESMSFAEVERTIQDFGERARENKIKLEELQGGTFTISNGGVYGSLLSTPIVNPPQSGVLGMHAIQDRPVAIDGQVVIRPMMYLALTYDHRVVDGREAVTFLKQIKLSVERPERLMLGI